jgi:hypothetical protein
LRARLAILAVAAVLAAIRIALPSGVFWISDAGNKFLVAENVRQGHLSIGYPAADLDPAFRWFPAAGGHFRRIGGHYFSIVPWVFPALAAPFDPRLLPLLAGIGVLMLIPPLLRAVGSDAHPALAVIAAAFATPLAFYSLDFWEHMPATLAATLAVLLLLRQRPILAGFAAGASIALRDEGYVLLTALVVALAVVRELRPRIWRLLLGAAVVVAPFWIAQWAIFGNPFGLHLAVHAAPDGVPLLLRLGRNLFYFLFQLHERPWIALLLAVPALAAVVAGSFDRDPSGLFAPLRRLRMTQLAAAIAVGIASAIGAAMMMFDPDPILGTIWTQGLFLFLPFTALFLTRWREMVTRRDAMGVLARVAAVYIVLMPLVLRANWAGVVWGPRYFLTIVPLLVVLSLRRNRLSAALVILSIGIELFGLVLLHRKLEATSQLAQLVRAAPEVVITDVYWLPEELSASYFEKKIMQPPDDRELLVALVTMRAHGVRRFTFVTSPRYRWFSPRARALVESMAVRRVRFDPPGVPLLRVEVLECTLPPA